MRSFPPFHALRLWQSHEATRKTTGWRLPAFTFWWKADARATLVRALPPPRARRLLLRDLEMHGKGLSEMPGDQILTGGLVPVNAWPWVAQAGVFLFSSFRR